MLMDRFYTAAETVSGLLHRRMHFNTALLEVWPTTDSNFCILVSFFTMQSFMTHFFLICGDCSARWGLDVLLACAEHFRNSDADSRWPLLGQLVFAEGFASNKYVKSG